MWRGENWGRRRPDRVKKHSVEQTLWVGDWRNKGRDGKVKLRSSGSKRCGWGCREAGDGQEGASDVSEWRKVGSDGWGDGGDNMGRQNVGWVTGSESSGWEKSKNTHFILSQTMQQQQRNSNNWSGYGFTHTFPFQGQKHTADKIDAWKRKTKIRKKERKGEAKQKKWWDIKRVNGWR